MEQQTSYRTGNDTPPLWPQDIRSEYQNLIRRIQSVARSQQGFAAISIIVFVNADGKPVAWTEPKRTCLEPKNSMQQLIELLGINNL